tara:strand:+ start:2630 stop:3949 length:1320 start_codon:yes stop_codon:yes gene_type:complete
MNKQKRTFLFALLSCLTFFLGCEDSDPSNYTKTIIETPLEYEFNSHFSESQSSVQKSEQVVHNMQIADLKTLTDYPAQNLGFPIFLENMMNLYDYNRSYNLSSWIRTNPPIFENSFNNISSSISSLKDNLNIQMIHGYSKATDELLMEWMEQIADNCTDLDKVGTYRAITGQNGINFSEIIHKTLLGSVVYSNAVQSITNLDSYDNTSRMSDQGLFTELENQWDISFGYFGSSNDYNTGYTDDFDRVFDPFFDSDSNELIDLKSEYNFNFSQFAASRDAAIFDESINFTQNIFNAYIDGRTIIHNQGSLNEIMTHRNIIIYELERVIASSIVHYLNKVTLDMDTLIVSDSTAGPLSNFSVNYNKNWSSLRGLIISLQFNDFKNISDLDLLNLVQQVGENPVYPNDGTMLFRNYQTEINDMIKNIFQTTYDFSDYCIQNW